MPVFASSVGLNLSVRLGGQNVAAASTPPPTPGTYTYLRPGAVFTYKRPGGTDTYKRP